MEKAFEHRPYERATGFLESVREELVEKYMDNSQVFLQRQSRVIDDYFRDAFQASMVGPRMEIRKNPYAIIALGGYGRQEQCLHSDIDLLFLFKGSIPRAAEELIREIVYPLWDLGFEVGYATRTLKDCVQLAKGDIEVLTSILDARFICGMSNLYTRMMEDLRKKILKRQAGKVVGMLVQANLERHRRFGDSAYMLEPNLKEGQGGLRDYHTMMWIARIKSGLKISRDLEYFGYFSHDEYIGLDNALHFIWTVRNRLHHLAGRKCDQLHLDYQKQLAEALGFKGAEGIQPVERFLGALHGQMEFVKQQHMLFLYELGYTPGGKSLRKTEKKTQIAGLEVRRNMLFFSSPEGIVKSPLQLMQIFEESGRLKIPVSPEARRLVREFSYLYDGKWRNDPEVVRSFERILMTPAPVFNVLNSMLMTGFLQKIIPEFSEIIDRIQYNEYHIYTVEKHSVRAVRALKSFGTPEDDESDPLCGDLYKELRGRKRLLWATLLHDIGKGGQIGEHSRKGAGIARRILTEKGLKPKEIETICFLIEEHLLLIKTATRRDINDEETAIHCARRIGDVETLKMLYLLTVADSKSTGPKAWNSWTAVLLREFFLKVLNILEKGELASREALESIELKKKEVSGLSDMPEDERDFLFQVMSPRYLLSTEPEAIVDHLKMFKNLGEAPFIWEIGSNGHSDTRTVTICAKDRPGLFSKIAGAFTLNGVDILDAQIYTWRNNIALDIFIVKPPPDRLFETERWGQVEKQLQQAMSGELDLGQGLKERSSRLRTVRPPVGRQKQRVVVDNDSSSFYSIVEVFAYDFPGLLFKITDALFRCGLDIWVAKIATKIDQVVDVFYVRDFDGQKVQTDVQVEAIKKAVLEVLSG